MTAAESLRLKDTLINNPETSPSRPFNFLERTQHILPTENTKLQTLLDETKMYADQHEMKVNHDKTKVMLFNTARNYDCTPCLSLGSDEPLELVEQVRLLGVEVRSDLSWRSNTSAICQKAYARMWMLRRLKPLGATTEELLNIYEKQIRCITEFASPVWTSGLTKDEVNQIERIQKCAFAIILEAKYTSYDHALKLMKRSSLASRRSDLNLKFAKKSLKSDKYQHWFVLNNPTIIKDKTRSKETYLLPVQARTGSFAKSPIAYLTRLLNENMTKS